MKLEEIIKLANDICIGLPDYGDSMRWHAYHCTIQGIINTTKKLNHQIEVTDNPTLEFTNESVHPDFYPDEDESPMMILDLHIGSREELFKCGTLFFVQVAKHGSDNWITYLAQSLEDRLTDRDYVSVYLDAKEDELFDAKLTIIDVDEYGNF